MDLFSLPVLAGVVLASVAGLVLGLFGGGGSILTTPILVYVVGLPVHRALPLSLWVVGATSVAGLVPHLNRVRWRAGLLFGGASMCGAFVGGRLAQLVPPALLLLAFGGVMLLAATPMVRGRTVPSERDARPSGVSAILGTGVLAGAVTGLVGAGGGFIVVPALTLVLRVPMRDAIATSLVVIALNALGGLLGHGSQSFDWPLAGVLGAAAVGGCLVGAVHARRIPQAVLRRAFGWFVLGIASAILVREAPTALGAPLPSAHSGALLAAVVGVTAVAATFDLMRARVETVT